MSTDHVTAQLHSARAAVAPGETFTVILRQKLAEGWHTYWRNSGDSGGATVVTWSKDAGAKIADMQFPTPKRIPSPPLMTYGYEGEILYPIAVTAPRTLRRGDTLSFSAKVETLVCADVCIPEDQFVGLTIPVEAVGRDDPEWGARAADALAALPKPIAGVAARITRQGEAGVLSVAGGPFAGVAAKDAYFYPYESLAIQHAALQQAQAGGDGFQFTLTAGKGGPLGQGALPGVVRIDLADGGVLAAEITATPGEPLSGVSGQWAAPQALNTNGSAGGQGGVAPAPGEVTSLGVAILFALLGGLILNVMPCVFPVLSMKALGLARTAHSGHARRHGVLFFAGVMATFLALAGVMIALSTMGARIGWGFQLQEPLVVAGLALVFFVIGLNLLGVFEVGVGMQNMGAGLAARGGDVGAFFTGALAVVAASPCTIPFMGGAVGFAAMASAAESLAVFAALGVGFAAPFTALAFAPHLLKRLPKPGPWMDVFKQAMAFPMFATAAWLVWVLGVGAGANGVFAVLMAALGAALLIWIFKVAKGPIGRSLGAGLAALCVGLGVWLLTPRAEAVNAQTWTPSRVEELRAEGAPVFVNFTAAWCVTCKANEWAALDRPAVQAAFAEKGVAYVKADWTRRDADIAAVLASYGRNGVPLYVYFAPGADGVVLPELLTEDIVLNALK